jgi:hypothetical protein
LSVFKVSNQKLSSVINCSSKNGVRINIYNCEYYALINKCNIFYRELMMWTAILKRQSHLQSFCVVPLCLILWLYVQYVVGKGKVLCDALREFKLLDCLNLLLFVQYTYNLYLYKVQRSAMIFLEKERNQPLQWTLITKSLLVLVKFLLCWVSEGLVDLHGST